LSSIPKELVVFLVSALPVGELRAGIPLGLGFGLDPWTVFALAVLGNLAPVIPILLFLEPASKWLMTRSRWFDEHLTRLFDTTRAKHSERIDRYGAIGLAIFVAIPSPGTGAWTGCLVAWLFGIELKYSVPAVAAGVLGAGIVVMAASTGALAIFKFLENPFISVGLFALVASAVFAIMRARGRVQ
jgi:uncharacterized membrane protein